MNGTESALDVKLRALHTDVSEIKGNLSALTEAITKLALIEERQATSNAAMERAFNSLSDLSSRVKSIELALPELRIKSGQSSIWIDRLIWAMVSGFIVYIIQGNGIA